MEKSILVIVRYTVKPGMRDAFYHKILELKVGEGSRAEEGNLKYDYYLPMNEENELWLLEQWQNAEVLAAHGQTEHYKRLAEIKSIYVEDTLIQKFAAEKM